ncbi:hypothetical protein OHA03_37515 [Streptomyces sp. NBC_00154]|nr:hypothetical protein [Streptomyces sp. NBC_00154]
MLDAEPPPRNATLTGTVFLVTMASGPSGRTRRGGFGRLGVHEQGRRKP